MRYLADPPAGGRSPVSGVTRGGRAGAASVFLILLLLTAAVSSPVCSAAQPKGVGLRVRIDTGRSLPFFHRGAVGLSIEASQLSSEVLGPQQGPLVELMRRLGPATLRIGGNSADLSWWTATGEPMPPWATNTITPQDLERLRQLLDAVGWQAVLTLNLGHFDPGRAASEAAAAVEILGPRLQAIEIGNEPNGFGNAVKHLRKRSYGVDDYLRELTIYRSYIDAKAPGLRLAGPDLSFAPSSHVWLPQIASHLPSLFAEITHHWYPTAYNLPDNRCRPTPTPSARDLLVPSVRERENAILSQLMLAGELANRPTALSETNTTASCNAAGGPDTSPVFASALWALDWSLRATEAGVGSLNFHGNPTRCAPAGFSPICTPIGKVAGPTIARPEYYGLIAATALEGGRFVPVGLKGRATTKRDVTAYATKRTNGTVTLAIIDFLPRGRTPVTIASPPHMTASTRVLSAPSIHARHGVRFGGASFGVNEGTQPKEIRLRWRNGGFRLVCRAGSAQIVTLKPGRG